MRSRLFLFALLLPNFAAAQDWSDFSAINPAYPCQDGWMGCIQDGQVVQPEVQTDSQGFPLPADLRIGWFDLEPTSGFSPFSALSEYPEGPLKRVQAEPEPEPVVADAGDEGTPEEGTDEASGSDAVADAAYIDPAAERARFEAEQRRQEEAEKRRAEQRAKEEADRARREAEARQREADERARTAAQALKMVQAAQNDADRKRLEAEAKAAEDARKKAEAEAAEAERMRQERERQEAEKREEARKAQEAARKAEEERKRKEAEEARKAEEQRKAEEARRKAAEAEAQRAAEEARRKAEAEAAARKAEAERQAKAAAAAMQAAKDEEERRRLEEEQRKAEEERKRAEAEAAKKAEEAAKKAEEDARRKAAEEEAARKAAAQAKLDAEREKIAQEKAAKEAQQQADAQAMTDAAAGDCSDLVPLEPKATLGKLPAPTTQCLENRLAASTRQTEKSKISRLLMANAFATNRTDWERLMKRHLEEIDQSDPDLCYKYSLQLSRKGPGSAYAAIKWADVALENRAVWTGSTYTSKVYSLYKVRTVAAQKIWLDLENKHAANPTDETNEKVKQARDRTKVFAREWYEYAKVADKDTTDALNMCKSAAATKKYCEAG